MDVFLQNVVMALAELITYTKVIQIHIAEESGGKSPIVLQF